MVRILLTGASGQVGSELLKTLAPLGEVVAPGRGEISRIFLRTEPASARSIYMG